MGEKPHPAPLVVAAFVAVYVIWGSTYLAIRVAVESIPPLTSAAIRFLVAGALLYAWKSRRAPRPTAGQWRSAALIGTLMLLGGNGGVVWAETLIDSGVAALLVATVPMWMVLLNGVRPGGVRPNLAEIGGLALGFAGVWVLVDPRAPGGVNPLGATLVVCGSFSWAIGSLFSRHADMPKTPLLGTAMQMLSGGVSLAIAALVSGEWARCQPAAWSARSLFALLYLVVFGSLIAFSAYIWLLRVSTPAKVGTYAFVNPVIAVVLGWAILNEPLTWATLVAMGLIVVAVVLATRFGRRSTPQVPAHAAQSKTPTISR